MISRSPKNENSKIIAWCLIIAPIFSNYVFISQIGFGDIFVFLTLPWLLTKIKRNTYDLILFTSAFIIIVYSFVLLGNFDVYAGFYRAAFYYLLILVVTFLPNFEFAYFLRLYGYSCVLASFALILQWVSYTWFGVSLSLQLPIEYYEPDTLKVIDHVFRGGGLFKEPSYFSLYVIPYFIFATIEQKFKVLFVMTVAGILSTSSLFFFLIMICCVIFFYGVYGAKIATILFSLTLGLMVLVFLNDFDQFVFLKRVKSIFTDGGTLNDRLLPFFEIINLDQFLFPSVDSFNFYRSAPLWFNSASSIVIYFGFFGLILLIVCTRKMGGLFGLTFITLVFSTHLMSGVFGYFMAISFMIIKRRVSYFFR
jgi:hypothetical protein